MAPTIHHQQLKLVQFNRLVTLNTVLPFIIIMTQMLTIFTNDLLI